MTRTQRPEDQTGDQTGEPEIGSSEVHGYAGWEYQKRVSVLMVLTFLAPDPPLAQSIELEPDTDEDFSADLDPEEQPVKVTASDVTLAPGSRRPSHLEIQVKKRSNMAWTPSLLRKVLLHRKEGNRAADQLDKNPKSGWLLVTNMPTNTELKEHKVERLEQWPAGGIQFATPPSWPKKLAEEDKELLERVADRVAILAQVTDPARDARDLLETLCHVPRSQQKACLEALCKRVEQAWTKEKPRVLTRQELLDQFIKPFGGRPDAQAFPGFFARPGILERAAELLEKKRLVILVGPAGIGKSTLTGELAHQRRRRVPSAELWRPGPEQPDLPAGAICRVRWDERHTVYLLDDWFGRWSMHPEASDRKAALCQAMRHDDGDGRIIITIRPEIFDQLCPQSIPTEFEACVLELDAGSYESDDLWSILLEQLESPTQDCRGWLNKHRAKITAELSEPMAYRDFGRRVMNHSGNLDDLDLDELIEYAQVARIPEHVEGLAQERAIEDVMLLWLAFHRASSSRHHERTGQFAVEREACDSLRRALRRATRESAQPWGLVKILQKAGRLNLEQSDAGDSEKVRLTAHPQVLRGLEQALGKNQEGALNILESLDDEYFSDQQSWKELLTIQQIDILEFPSLLQERLDDHLEKNLLDTLDQDNDRDFDDALWRLARYGQARTPVALIALALHDPGHQLEAKRWFRKGYPERWQAPNWNVAEWQSVSKNPEVEKVARRFAEGLSFSWRWATEQIPYFFRRLGWDLSNSFGGPASGSSLAEHTRVLGALLTAPEPHFDDELARLMHEYQHLDDEWQTFRRDDTVHESRPDEFVDEYYDVEQRLLGYVEARRAREGWQWLTTSSHLHRLIKPWAELLVESVQQWTRREGLTPPDRAEFEALWQARAQDPENVCHTVAVVMVALGEKEAAVQRFLDTLEEPIERTSLALIRGLFVGFFSLGNDLEQEQTSDQRVCSELARLALSEERQAACLYALEKPPPVGLRSTRGRIEPYRAAIAPTEVARSLAAVLGDRYQADLVRIDKTMAEAIRAAARTTSQRLDELADCPAPEIAAAALNVLARAGHTVAERIVALWNTLQAHSSEPLGWDNERVLAILLDACAQDASEPALDFMQREGLSASVFWTRVTAIRAFGDSELSLDGLREFVNDRSPSVRAACAKTIAERAWRPGLPHLHEFLQDRFNNNPFAPYEGDEEFTVARAAAKALSAFRPLDSETLSEVREAAASASSDRTLRQELAALLAPATENGIGDDGNFAT